ncbi:FtsQ-type POTRA domain-containing protein [Deinococcus sp.]|uniref:cell division protein FtsQ/DivIB n=1 Tax=Deinococcus sp. TaxID=47478 RepID=UPI002869B785|nr:FtsQ-type POTRA domain-containing protein [Deinococcus sp.]
MTTQEQAAPTARRRWPWVAGAVVVGAALAGSWFGLPIRQVGVMGNRQVPAARIKALAGAQAGFGWLYYGGWRARGVLNNPWIESAVVTRRYPDGVSIAVTERVPVARWEASGRVQAVAADGAVMPGGVGLGALPFIQGWGPDRHLDALRVIRALSAYNVRSVEYTPAGLRVKLPSGSIWSGDLESLLKYAGSISMYPNKDLTIYPWGVSVQE